MQKNSKIVYFYKKNKFYTFIRLIVSIIISLIALLSPFFISEIVDSLVTSNIMKLKLNLYFFVSLLVIQMLVTYFSTGYMANWFARVNFRTFSQYFLRIPYWKYSSLVKLDIKYIVQTVREDVDFIVNFLTVALPGCFINLTSLLVCSYFIVKQSKFLFFMLSLMLLGNYIIIVVISPKLQFEINNAIKSRSKYLTYLFSQALEFEHIKINSLYLFNEMRLNKNFGLYYRAIESYNKMNNRFILINEFFYNAFTFIFILILGVLVLKNEITVGHFILFNSYIKLIFQYSSKILNFYKEFQEYKTHSTRLDLLYSEQLESGKGAKIDCVKSISMKHTGPLNAINNRNCDFDVLMEPGNVYLLKGKNGAGKTTLIRYILGFFSDSFDIKYNLISLRHIDEVHLREKCISVLTQNTIFSEYSQMKLINISLDTRGEDYFKFRCYYDSLFLNDMIQFDQFSNLDFGKLSGGELQKLKLIEVFLNKSNFIILDEPNNNLDVKSILAVKEIIRDIKSDKIILIVTHDDFYDDLCKDSILL